LLLLIDHYHSRGLSGGVSIATTPELNMDEQIMGDTSHEHIITLNRYFDESCAEYLFLFICLAGKGIYYRGLRYKTGSLLG